MKTLLTTRDVQELINVDKSTIYRMAEDGRLPAVKVGRQWRFPASGIASLLDGGGNAPVQHLRRTRVVSLRDVLSSRTAQAFADLLGEVFGAMAVVTAIDGTPLTTVANPCGFYDAVAGAPGALDRCIDAWRRLGSAPDLESKLMPSHLGFLCARSYVRYDDRLIGMAIVGGITPDTGPLDAPSVRRVADDMGIPAQTIALHASETYDLTAGERKRLIRLLPRFTDLVTRFISAGGDDLATVDTMATAIDAGGHQ